MGCMPVPLPELYELCEKLDLTNASLEGSSTTTWEISTSRITMPRETVLKPVHV